MSINTTQSLYCLPQNRTVITRHKQPYRVEANPDNLERCIRLKNPFLYKFSEPCDDFYLNYSRSKFVRNIYSPIEYAIKLNDTWA